MSVKLIAILFGSLLFCLVVELVRREKLSFKYAFGWMLVCVLAALLAVFDKYLNQAAYFFGFELTSNFIFFGLLCCFVFLSLLMTIFLCQQDRRNQIIAQKIALLESELRGKDH